MLSTPRCFWFEFVGCFLTTGTARDSSSLAVSGVRPTHMLHQRSTEPSPALTDGGSTSDVHQLDVAWSPHRLVRTLGRKKNLYWFKPIRFLPTRIDSWKEPVQNDLFRSLEEL